jgi:hypothetical protein
MHGPLNFKHEYRFVPAGVETYTALFRILQKITNWKSNTVGKLRTSGSCHWNYRLSTHSDRCDHAILHGFNTTWSHYAPVQVNRPEYHNIIIINGLHDRLI